MLNVAMSFEEAVPSDFVEKAMFGVARAPCVMHEDNSQGCEAARTREGLSVIRQLAFLA